MRISQLRRYLWRTSALGVLFLLLPLLEVQAQSTTANIVGTVYDPSGAIVPGVEVTATHVETGRKRSTVSDDIGAYVLRTLPIGQYLVTAERQGFKKEEVKDLLLQIDQTARIDFRLMAGEVSEVITVEGGGTLLSPTTSDIGAVVGNKRIVELPLNRREFLQLAQLEPGVTPPPPGTFLERNQGAFTTVAATGMRQEYQSVTINGINNMDPQNNNLAVRPSVDAVQEFKIQTSNFSAELGSKGGVVVNLAIKSGTNSFHGGLFEFLRNDVFDAKNFFDITKDPPPYNQNQFGGTIGGPVIKNKSFFFFAYEGLRIRQSQTSVNLVPTVEQRSGFFDPSLYGIIYDPLTYDPVTRRRQPFLNNTIPGNRIHPTSKKVLDYVDLPNNLSDPRRNLITNPKEEDDINQYNSRVDHSFGANDNLFVSYNITDRRHLVPSVGSVAGATPAGGFSRVGGARFNDRSQHVSASYAHIFSPTLINELRVGLVRFQHNEISRNQGKTFEAEFGIPATETEPANVAFPTVSVTGYNFPAEGRTILYWNTVYQVADSLSFQKGSHSFKLGGDFQQINNFNRTCNLCVGSYSFSGQYVSASQTATNGDAFAQFLLGDLSGISRTVPSESYVYGHQFAFYVQDDWRLTPKLAFNLGLRYDTVTSYKEKQDRMASWDPLTGEVVYPENVPLILRDPVTHAPSPFVPSFPFRKTSNRGLYEADHLNFAPRFGLAYQLSPNTVIRGAYGIFNALIPSRHAILSSGNNTPFAPILRQIIDPDIPNKSWNDGFIGAGQNTSIDIWKAAPLTGFHNPYVQGWNIGFQRSLSNDVMVDLAYVGSGGRHLDQLREQNIPAPGAGQVQTRRPFPLIGTVREFYDGGLSNYHSMQLKVVKQFTRGLALNVAYTLSKSIDHQSTDTGTGGDISGTENPFSIHQSMRGPSAFDLPQRFVFNYVWELPFGPGKSRLEKGAVAQILGGWQMTGILSLQSGYPYTVSATSRTNNGTGGRPDRTCNGTLSNPTLNSWFDTSCFPVSAQFSYGNSGRNILRNDGFTNFDTGLFKNFALPALGEQARLQFRAEIFNLFNHPNFGLPVRNINSNTRGAIIQASTSRQVQFGLKLNF